jgi:hypothetical protein
VIFPGLFVEGKSTGEDVWVLNENSLQAFLEREKETLNSEETNLIAHCLESHIRSGMKQI